MPLIYAAAAVLAGVVACIPGRRQGVALLDAFVLFIVVFMIFLIVTQVIVIVF